jgi:hypothetical protein
MFAPGRRTGEHRRGCRRYRLEFEAVRGSRGLILGELSPNRHPIHESNQISCVTHSALCLVPSSCTQGEGEGGGRYGSILRTMVFEKGGQDPHPCPPPVYRERGKKAAECVMPPIQSNQINVACKGVGPFLDSPALPAEAGRLLGVSGAKCLAGMKFPHARHSIHDDVSDGSGLG